MILANRVPLSVWGGGDYIIDANQAGKRACSLLNCISLTDDTETNEQDKSIATGHLYAHSEFDAFSTFEKERLHRCEDVLFSITCNFYSDKIITPQARFCWTLWFHMYLLAQL